METRACVVGSGIFGVTAALALRRRGHAVRLVDAGPIPHPLAESTDISKIVRAEYGDDELYTALMEEALVGWRRWEAAPFFHETGVMFLRRSPFEPGSFEGDSYDLLTRRGHRLERLDAAAIARRFPAWSAGAFVDACFNPEGGWAESGRVVAKLVDVARDAGVEVAERTAVLDVVETAGRVTGVRVADGGLVPADVVVVATGAWAPDVVADLAPHLRAVGQPVFHLRPLDPSLFQAGRFPVFGADIARTGYYGFPASAEGIVKIANHGVGRPVHPGDEGGRVVSAEQIEALRAFLASVLPALADAPIASTRVCVYGDTWDQHFLVAPHPAVRGLVVATGGSGHAFKFAPLLGGLIADAVEGKVVPRFAWRQAEGGVGGERARHQG